MPITPTSCIIPCPESPKQRAYTHCACDIDCCTWMHTHLEHGCQDSRVRQQCTQPSHVYLCTAAAACARLQAPCKCAWLGTQVKSQHSTCRTSKGVQIAEQTANCDINTVLLTCSCCTDEETPPVLRPRVSTQVAGGQLVSLARLLVFHHGVD